jgi:hypothetical protein
LETGAERPFQDDIRHFRGRTARVILTGNERHADGLALDRKVEVAMQVTLSPDEASVLVDVLTDTLRDMSYEIAATDNAHYRSGLIERRATIEAVESAVRTSLEHTDQPSGPIGGW